VGAASQEYYKETSATKSSDKCAGTIMGAVGAASQEYYKGTSATNSSEECAGTISTLKSGAGDSSETSICLPIYRTTISHSQQTVIKNLKKLGYLIYHFYIPTYFRN
jgi:hypothetical protein